MVIILSKGQNR